MTHTISLRISSEILTRPERWQELAAILKQPGNPISEVAFFTGFTHPPRLLPVILEIAGRLKHDFIPAARTLGLRAGINHLATIGHLDENTTNSLSEPWQHLVDLNGSVSSSCYCASDPQVQEYIRQCYRALADANPDFIWVDDDVRLESHPQTIQLSCFCPLCLQKFSQQTGQFWTRAGLKAAFNQGPRRKRLAIRQQWQAHIQQYIAGILTSVREAVDEINPDISLGLMTGEISYSSYGYPTWVETLAGKRRVEVKWRPGGGFYTDEYPLLFANKIHSVGRQSASLPGIVGDIQYEHENFPYQALRKSQVVFKAEMAAAVAAGCTGVALNMLGDPANTYEEFQPLFSTVQQSAGFIAAAAKTFQRSQAEGIWIPFTSFHFSALALSGNWETAPLWGADFTRYEELFQIGLPAAYAATGARLTLLTPEACVELARSELLDCFRQGVLMDGPTLERLQELGLDHYAGFKVKGRKDQDAIEKLTNDPLNDRFAGWVRDCRPSFYQESIYLLEPAAAGARPLAEVIDFTSSTFGTTAGIYENELGGRVAVLGYFPWRMLQSLAKIHQMRALCRWLGRDSLPGYISSFHKGMIWFRRDAQNRPAALVLNNTLDAVHDLKVSALTGSEALKLVRMDGTVSTLPQPAPQDGYSQYTINHLGPWEAVLLAVQPEL